MLFQKKSVSEEEKIRTMGDKQFKIYFIALFHVSGRSDHFWKKFIFLVHFRGVAGGEGGVGPYESRYHEPIAEFKYH